MSYVVEMVRNFAQRVTGITVEHVKVSAHSSSSSEIVDKPKQKHGLVRLALDDKKAELRILR